MTTTFTAINVSLLLLVSLGQQPNEVKNFSISVDMDSSSMNVQLIVPLKTRLYSLFVSKRVSVLFVYSTDSLKHKQVDRIASQES